LKWAKDATADGNLNNSAEAVAKVQQRVIDTINAVKGLEVEYYEIVDQTTLLPTNTFDHAIGCVTVYCGPVRLIDNIKYE
jgi:pantoate--beta-alanine ligase